ncbi:MAG: UDP-N-acetylmuramate--L-alanine ligase [Bacteroidota bacterium]
MKPHIFFIGIGGIGMSALARYFHHLGFNVFGYDKTSTAITRALESLGINCVYTDSVQALESWFSNLNATQIQVVYTPAVPQTSAVYQYFKTRGIAIKKRAEVLGAITQHQTTVAIAGTHGKTTTTTMVTHLLKDAGLNITAFMGGISANYQSNLVLGHADMPNHIMVVEADEYDRSFHHLRPHWIILTSTDADHLDVYETPQQLSDSYQAFVNLLNPNGVLIVKNSVNNQITSSGITYTYDLNLNVHYSAQNIRYANDASSLFDLNTPHGLWKNMICPLPGIHNVENAIAALALAQQLGISEVQARNSLASYKGVQRRFEIHVASSQLYFIDDYAHHPAELVATLQSARALFLNKPITGIFQPHLFSRTRDFKNEFAEALSLLDHCILMPIYPARESPIPGVNSEALLELVKAPKKQIMSAEAVLQFLKVQTSGVFITLGAGDIGQLAATIAAHFKLQIQK